MPKIFLNLMIVMVVMGSRVARPQFPVAVSPFRLPGLVHVLERRAGSRSTQPQITVAVTLSRPPGLAPVLGLGTRMMH